MLGSKVYNIGLLFIVLISFFISLLGGVFLFFLWSLSFKRVTIYGYLFPLLVIATIAFTQYSTTYDGDYDIVRYYTSYNLLSQCDLLTALLVIGVLGDYFFYFIVYLLSQVFPNDPRIMGFFFAFVTGGIMLIAYKNIALYAKKYDDGFRYFHTTQLLLWIIGFVFFISFTNYVNAYRQFFAMSLFLWAFSKNILHKSSLFIFILAFLSHWSIIMYLIPFYIFRFQSKLFYIYFLLAFIVGILGITSMLNSTDLTLTDNYIHGEILGVDKTLILVLLLTILILAYVLSKFDIQKRIYSLSLIFILWDFLFLRNSTLSVRLLFSISQLYTILFPLILLNNSGKMNNKYKNWLLVSALLLFLYNMKSLCFSNFSYQIFTDYSLWNSICFILNTPFPTEIIS